MRVIYPKINEYLEGLETLLPTIKRYKGVEIQYFHKSTELEDFQIEKAIRKLKQKCSFIQEITIHPPLNEYNIELLLLKNSKIVENQINQLVFLSRELGIKLNIIYHTRWKIKEHELTTIEILKKFSNLMEGSNVNLLLENIYMMEEKKDCTVLELCDKIQSSHIKVCMDLCHLYCQSHIYHMDMKEYIKQYLSKEKCEKYVYQIHFADTKEEDGYINKETHGRVHEEKQKAFEDLKTLDSYGMQEAIIVPEVSEENYQSRQDQRMEIQFLEEYFK